MKSFAGSGRQAFSLIEVALALGIGAFCLVTLLALFSIGFSNSSKAGDDTNIAAMMWEVAGNLHSPTNAAGWPASYSFDASGQMLTNLAPSSVYYSCRVTTAPCLTEIANVSTNLNIATLQFTYPATVQPSPHTNTVYVAIPPP